MALYCFQSAWFPWIITESGIFLWWCHEEEQGGGGGGLYAFKEWGDIKKGEWKKKGGTDTHFRTTVSNKRWEISDFSSSENLVNVLNEWSPTLDFVSFKVKKLLGIAAKFAFDIKEI